MVTAPAGSVVEPYRARRETDADSAGGGPRARRSAATSWIFERVVAVAGLSAAVLALLTLLLGVVFVGASQDMLADPLATVAATVCR